MDAMFEEEQRHLSATYEKLEQLEQQLTETLSALSAEAGEDIANMRDELFMGQADHDQTLETLAEFELMNKVIDSYNITSDINREKLARVLMLKKHPYFAKVTLQMREGAQPKDIYIGVAGMTDENYRHFIVDWRSPVAEVYYNQENGPTSYRANGRTITCNLLKRRQFSVDGPKLLSCFDTTVAIEDPLLLELLASRRSDKMTAITTTIQREQNQVIRHEDVPVLLVNGIAGSGKTSVLLQRVAYLFYTYREELDPGNVVLITPNPVFQRYIDHVLPEMGERNPRTITFADFLQRAGAGHAGKDEGVTLEALEEIDRAVEGLELEAKDFCDVKVGKRRLVPASQAFGLYSKYKKVPLGPRRVALVAEELRERLENRLKSLAKDESVQAEVMELAPEEQSRLFGSQVFPQSEEEMRELAQRYLDVVCAPAFDEVDNASWLRVDRIGARVLGKENLSRTEWVYLKLALTGEGDRHARFVMLDEVQDYTQAQLKMLGRYFNNAHFLLLGDENQAVKPGTATFDQVKSLFTSTHGQVDECRLLTSYRSTPEITALFAGLLEEDARIQVQSVQREGQVPQVRGFEDSAAYEQALVEAVRQGAAQPGLTAVVCANRKQAKQVAALLGAVPAGKDGCGCSCEDGCGCEDASVVLVGEGDALPHCGAVVLHLELAKGLEFDRVVIPDATAAFYPESPLSRRRLYTALSRATRQVTVLAEGALTPLLSAGK